MILKMLLAEYFDTILAILSIFITFFPDYIYLL